MGTAYEESNSFIVIVCFLLEMQVGHLAVVLLLEIEKVLIVVLLERILNPFKLRESFVILRIVRESGQALLGQDAEGSPLDLGDCCVLILQLLLAIVE